MLDATKATSVLTPRNIRPLELGDVVLNYMYVQGHNLSFRCGAVEDLSAEPCGAVNVDVNVDLEQGDSSVGMGQDDVLYGVYTCDTCDHEYHYEVSLGE
jgi:hypothetical protein